MKLTAVQEDALIELLNIGFGRAASSLSQLTGHRVLLEVPHVTIHPIDEVTASLERVILTDVASVHQIVSGAVSGDALLILDQAGASMLKELLTNEPALPLSIDASAREVITEVGNIVLNACLGVFGNLLRVQVSFSVPRLHVESVEQVFSSITVADRELEYALMIHTRFFVQTENVSGYLVIVLGVTSLDRLLYEVRQWEERQMA